MDNELDPVQKGCRNLLYILYGIITVPITCLGLLWLVSAFTWRPELLTMPDMYGNVWPIEKVLLVGGAMIVLPMLFLSWVFNKLPKDRS